MGYINCGRVKGHNKASACGARGGGGELGNGEEECGVIHLWKNKNKKSVPMENRKSCVCVASFNPGWGWTCHLEGFSALRWLPRDWRWHLPTGRGAVVSPSAPRSPPQPHRDSLQKHTRTRGHVCREPHLCATQRRLQRRGSSRTCRT